MEPTPPAPGDLTLDDEHRAPPMPSGRLQRGDELGRYVILELLGAGGMGVVYAAYDPQLDRKVAIKLLHRERDGKGTEGRARLLREAKALAQLAHPNVVGVHEAGTVDGRVYLVMEHVEGQTLTAWLEGGPRSRPEILEVFLAAGEGLAAAHAKGLVHRDFKPDNVMVDDSGRVRVMDFGLARAPGAVLEASSEPELRPDTLLGKLRASSELSMQLTRRSALVGTPSYMAPEQWRMEGLDARTDQFSFCVALYESLYGQRPFSAAAPAALMVAVLEGEVEPPPAGARVPAWLRKVVVRGLALAPDDRWEDMPRLLAALRDDPTASRRRWIAGGVVVALGMAAIGVQRWVQSREQRRCEAEGQAITEVWSDEARGRLAQGLERANPALASATWERVEPRLDGYAEAWASARTEACLQPPTYDGVVLGEQAEACLDDRRAAFEGLVDAVAEGQSNAVERAVKAAATLPPVERCEDAAWLSRKLSAPSDPETRQAVSEVRSAMSRNTARAQVSPGEETIERARALLERAREVGWTPTVAEAQLALGMAQVQDARMEPAEQAFTQAYLDAVAVDDIDLALEAAHRLVFVVGTGLHRAEEAELWLRLANAGLRRLEVPEVDLRRADHLDVAANLYFNRGEIEEAIAVLEHQLEIREALLGPEHPSSIDGLASLANAYSGQGRGDEARALLEQVLELEKRVLGPEHPTVAWGYMDLALALGVEQRYDESHEMAERALEIRRKVFGPRHRWVGHSLDFMCAADADRGRLDRAEKECAEALAINREALGEDHPDTAWTYVNIGIIAAARGDVEEARRVTHKALGVYQSKLGDESPRTTAIREALSRLDGPEGHGIEGHGPEEGAPLEPDEPEHASADHEAQEDAPEEHGVEEHALVEEAGDEPEPPAGSQLER